MSKFNLTFEMGNSAFTEDNNFEVCRILKELADNIRVFGLHEKLIRDINGNIIGKLEILE